MTPKPGKGNQGFGTEEFALWNQVSTIGALITLAGVGFFFLMLIEAFIVRRKVGDNYWGEGATTLEWTLSSPPPFHQFETLPVIEDHHTAHDHMSKPQPA